MNPPPYNDKSPPFPQGNYNAWGQNAGYVNPAFPAQQPPPNYDQPPQPQPALHMVQVGQPPLVQHQPFVAVQQTESTKARTLNIFGFGLGVVVLLLVIVGISTDYWGITTKWHYGLFKVCFPRHGICLSSAFASLLSPITMAIRAFSIIGLIETAIAVLLHALVAFGRYTPKRGRATAAIVLYAISTCCLLIAVVLFGVFTEPPTLLGWSFFLTVVGIIGCFALSIIVGIARSEYSNRGCVINRGSPPVVATVS